MSAAAEYQKSMAQAAREALRSLLARHPNTSVAELRELIAEHRSLGGITLAELVGRDGTHTAEGRTALDRAVLKSLAAFGGVSVSAEALRARLGATPAQLRSSLNRHIEAGEVSFSGQARGTRYSLEG